MNDPIVQDRMIRLSLWLFAIGFVIGGCFIGFNDGLRASVNLWTFIFALIFYALAIPLHELVHAVFFLLYGDNTKIRFGFKNGLAYASAPGVFYKRHQYLIIALSPFILISTLTLLIGSAQDHIAIAIIVLVLHTASCAGDFYYTYQLLTHPEVTYCEDTDAGVTLYK